MSTRFTAEKKKEIVQQIIVCDCPENRSDNYDCTSKYNVKELYKMGLIHRLDCFYRLYDILKHHSTQTFFHVSVTNFDACVKAYLDL